MKFGIRDLYVMLLRMFEFVENCHREGRTFLMVVTLHLLVCRETVTV